MELRTAISRDLPAIASLSQTTPWEKTAFLSRQIDLGNVTVAEEDGAIRGFIAWSYEFFEKPFVWLIVVAASHRKRGIATQLFDCVRRRCAGDHLYTSTNRSNAVMASLLQRLGYQRVGEIDLDPGDPEVFYRIGLCASALGA
jgi:GNAT superfamily N-acetyltransferase